MKLQVEGRFSSGRPWTFTVARDGAARLRIERYPRDQVRTLRVTAAQLAALDRELAAVRFFALGSEYGDRVPASSVRTLTVTQAGRTKTIRLLYLRNDAGRRTEVKRALRV